MRVRKMKSFRYWFWTSVIQVNILLNFDVVFSSLYFPSRSLQPHLLAPKSAKYRLILVTLKMLQAMYYLLCSIDPACLTHVCGIPFPPSPPPPRQPPLYVQCTYMLPSHGTPIFQFIQLNVCVCVHIVLNTYKRTERSSKITIRTLPW
jgi:hypothetical protein